MSSNLVEMIVPELLQSKPHRKTSTPLELLLNPSLRQQTLADYQQMRRSLGTRAQNSPTATLAMLVTAQTSVHSKASQDWNRQIHLVIECK